MPRPSSRQLFRETVPLKEKPVGFERLIYDDCMYPSIGVFMCCPRTTVICIDTIDKYPRPIFQSE
jgi:hypothetical protein